MMNPQSRISELALIIQSHTAKIDTYFAKNYLAPLSFGLSASQNLPSALSESRNAILEATEELNQLVNGPLEYFIDVVANRHNHLISLRAIYEFNIATSFPVGETTTLSTISEKCSLPLDITTSVLRQAMTYRIFTSSPSSPEEIAHTPISALLATNTLLHAWLGMVTAELWPSACHAVDAMIKWPGSQDPFHTGWNLANGTEEPKYKVFSKDPARTKRFADAMSLFHSSPGFAEHHLVDGFPWDKLGDGKERVKIVDVGGSNGDIAIAIASKFEKIDCLVQDLPEVVNAAVVPEALGGRVKFMAHDFFEEQPVKGADVYILRCILHNWSDKYCILILRALIPALKNGAKVILSEVVLPQVGAVSLLQERFIRMFDLVMRECFNAKERSAEDWTKLFEAADQSLKLENITVPPGSNLAIIVASWEGNTIHL